MEIPDFSKIEFKLKESKINFEEWKDAFYKQTGVKFEDFVFRTLEWIDILPLYTY
ncbi:MAG: hypothetical protein ACK4SO_05780 [Candidatus Kapaibacteriota bacterium]